MIVDLKLSEKSALVVGGGRQATKKAAAMAKEGCCITVASMRCSNTMEQMARDGVVDILRQDVGDDSILDAVQTDVVVAATDNMPLNRMIAKSARKRGIISYSVSDPAESDYSHLAVAEIRGLIKVAVSTGGKSPSMAKTICCQIQKILEETISDEQIECIMSEGARRGTPQNKSADLLQAKGT